MTFKNLEEAEPAKALSSRKLFRCIVTFSAVTTVCDPFYFCQHRILNPIPTCSFPQFHNLLLVIFFDLLIQFLPEEGVAGLVGLRYGRLGEISSLRYRLETSLLKHLMTWKSSSKCWKHSIVSPDILSFCAACTPFLAQSYHIYIYIHERIYGIYMYIGTAQL